METLITKKRLDWIDCFRGMAMLFVIIGHFCGLYFNTNMFFIMTSPVKIPLFFAITGYIFKFRDGNIKAFLIKLFWGLIIPWFLLTLYPFGVVFFFVMGNWSKVIELTVRFFTDGLAWYMPCCIIAEFVFFCIQKAVKKRHMQYVVMVVVGIIGYSLSVLHIGDILNFNTALIAQIFILIGYAYKNELAERLSKTQKLAGASICISIYVLIIIVTALFYKDIIDVHNNHYYNLPLCFFAIYSGCMFLMLIGEYIRPWKWLCFIGRNTLVYYMLNSICAVCFLRVIRLFGMSLPDNMIKGLVLTLVSCIGCAILSVLLNRYAPVAVGKGLKRNRSKKETKH